MKIILKKLIVYACIHINNYCYRTFNQVYKMYIAIFFCIYTGQFWNIPITVTNTGSVIHVIEISGNNPRSFFTIRQGQTYDGTRRVCYYGFSTIEGTFTQYKTKSLFATNYAYTRFDDKKCK